MNWMSDNHDFSLDDLVVDEEEIRSPVIMPVTILVCETEYDEQNDLMELVDGIRKNLFEKYGFRKGNRKRREGFLDFSSSENNIKCIYARETPIRIDFEKGDLKLTTKRLRGINPSYRVLINIGVTKKKTRVVLFSGTEKITSSALGLVNYCIRGSIEGGFKTFKPGFSKEEMYNMLSQFGMEIQYVFLSPGESEKLKKMAKKRVKGEIKEIPLYFVRAKFAGIRVVAAPVVLDLIQEGKITILEIEGKLIFGVGISITSRVSSSGRITFFIPEQIVGRNQTAYDIAEKLYERIISERTGVKQTSMEDFSTGSV